MNKTAIEWTTFSANPLKYRRKSDGKVVWACVKTSPGCAHCYAEALALRFDRGKLFTSANMDELEPFLDEAELRKILTAKTIGGVPVIGSRVFLNDMTDMFGEWVPDALLDRLLATMALRPDVTFQVLTKQAERMRDYMQWNGHSDEHARRGENCPCRQCSIVRVMAEIMQSSGVEEWDSHVGAAGYVAANWPLPNVWLGVSCENKATLSRLYSLRDCPARLRFVSFEPLLEDLGRVDLTGIGWAIIGGESGRNARPCQVDWIRSLVQQCKAASAPCFVKQLGSRPLVTFREFCDLVPCPPAVHCRPGTLDRLPLCDSKGGDMAEFPPDLRVREMPGS